MTTVADAPEVAEKSEPVTSTVAPPPPASERLVALDVFRGMTIAGMLLVNDPGSWNAIYPPLEHAEWHGWTPTDLVFPFFLFIVGVTTHLSLGRRRAEGADRRAIVAKILRRGGMIFLIGLLLNWFPFYWAGRIAGSPDPTLGERILYKIAHLRYLGVLQRIGIAYTCAALLTVYLTRRRLLITIGAILIGYWMLITLLPVPGTGTIGYFTLDQPARTLEAWTDQTIIGLNHIWSGSKWWDPEGLLSTLPAIATALLGVFAGEWIADKRRPLVERVVNLFGFGALGLVVGRFWHSVFPINKNLWTSSYVIFTAGFACVFLATCLWMIDIRGWKRWTTPFVIYGVNPLLAFAGSGLTVKIFGSMVKVPVHGKPTPLTAATYQLFYEPFFEPKFGSLLWAITFVLVWLAILSVFYRKRWILRV